MWLKPTKLPNGRTNLAIVKGYREAGTGKVKSKTMMRIGYLDVLEKEYPDPIAHFTELARQMTKEEQNAKKTTLSISMNEELPPETDNRRNYGYSAIMKHSVLLKVRLKRVRFMYQTKTGLRRIFLFVLFLWLLSDYCKRLQTMLLPVKKSSTLSTVSRVQIFKETCT